GITICDMFLFVFSKELNDPDDDFRYYKLVVSDTSNYFVDLLISKEQYQNREIRHGDVLFITYLNIYFTNDSGYQLNTNNRSIIEINLDHPQTTEIKRANPIRKEYLKHHDVFYKHNSLLPTTYISELLRIRDRKMKFEKFENIFIRAKI